MSSSSYSSSSRSRSASSAKARRKAKSKELTKYEKENGFDWTPIITLAAVGAMTLFDTDKAIRKSEEKHKREQQQEEERRRRQRSNSYRPPASRRYYDDEEEEDDDDGYRYREGDDWRSDRARSERGRRSVDERLYHGDKRSYHGDEARRREDGYGYEDDRRRWDPRDGPRGGGRTW
ncbi:hypothetical protein B0I35DRAFT_472735 [Stachybotrys elegans]|uniref:Uncharacterized protein n=1 Tax=Stachybotrys elegans TaxID=80388 RepID=A0A8K0WVU2_9HYPO|nr:hypothetical protein B0I35DRAFT_472735 [Stachybotrys elegans]